METITLSKQVLDRATEELNDLARQRGYLDPEWARIVAKVREQRAAPPLCLGCGARNHPDDHGALPCGH